MNRIHIFNKIMLFFFVLLFVISCKVLNDITLQKDKTKENHPKIIKTQGSGPENNVFCGLLDKSGNLWFGTTGEGVYHFEGKTFTNYTTKDGLNSNSVWSIIEEKNGTILFGTGYGICRYDGKSFVDLTLNTALGNTSISAMLEDSKGRLWACDYRFGYYKRGIYLCDPSTQKTKSETFVDFLSLNNVQNDDDVTLIRTNCILEDGDGNIWFAGQNGEGLIRYDGKILKQFREEVGLYDEAYRSMLLDKNGNLWLGTQPHGVLCCISPKDLGKGEKLLNHKKGSFINITENTGLNNSTIMSMIEDKKGNLWFSTDGEGVWRYDGKSFKNFNTEDGLLNNSVSCIIEDKKGNIWFGTRNTGLYRYDGKSILCFSE